MYFERKYFKQKKRRKGLALCLLWAALWTTVTLQGRAEENSFVQEEEATQALEKTVWQEGEFAPRKETAEGEETLPAIGQTGEQEEDNSFLEGLVQQGSHYVLYIDGSQVTQEGWKMTDQGTFYVDSSGYVSSKLEKAKEVYRCYNYDDNTAQWQIQKNTWRSTGDREYYFNKSGISTTIYYITERTCQKYKNGKMTAVKKEIRRLADGKWHYFNANGVCATDKGWQKISGKEYINIGKNGYVISRMRKTGVVWKYDDYNYQDSKWERQKAFWGKVDGKEYYFNQSGISTRIYEDGTGKCKEYSKGSMRSVKNKIVKLADGKPYYFNKKGNRTTAKGWKVISDSSYVQIGEKGYAACKMERKKGVWRYYRYYAGNWEKQKNVWKYVRKCRYFFNASGACTRIYDTAAYKCYDIIKGKKKLVVNDMRTIRDVRYYFGTDGTRAKKAGMYLTCFGKLICTDAHGRVVKEIPGRVLSYETGEGMIISCKVQEANILYYYNGDGSLRRKLDMNAPMVALTYDDGPSQYTPVILDILRQYGGAATFFVVGQRVPSYADVVRNACRMGCEIGNHTYSHQVLTKTGVLSIVNQIGTTNAAVQNVTGVSPVVMRPPGGGQNPTVRNAVGMPLILWSIDTLDWKTKNASATQTAVLNHVKDGDIILMHDLYNPTAEASKVIIPELVRRGYQLVTVSELADCRGGMAKGMVYRAFPR
ncbi:polysaccharide deacetylase family protein [Lachnospiraceae bacterium 45-W7]